MKMPAPRAAIFAAISALLLLIAGIAIARYEDQLYADQQTRDITEQAQILAASVPAAVSFADTKATKEHVDALRVNPELEAAGVYGPDGALLAEFSRSKSLKSKLGNLPNKPDVALASGGLTVTVPVLVKDKVIGAVSVIATTEPSLRRNARYLGLIMLVSMGALVIAVLGFSQVAISTRARQLNEMNLRLQQEMAEREKTEEALRQSHKMEAIGQLSGGIAHDFNNLIMIVKGNLSQLRKRIQNTGANNERVGFYIHSAEDALDRAATLTQRILAFSRRQPLSAQPIRLNDLVTGLQPLIRHSIGEKIELIMDLRSEWLTTCDPSQMENVVLNLAINGRDAMPEGGRLFIATADVSLPDPVGSIPEFEPGDYVHLIVRDNGKGMAPDILARALDPFFTTKPVGKGTGLGLSMAFGFVRQSNGYLSIESAPGDGTAINIYMPKRPDQS